MDIIIRRAVASDARDIWELNCVEMGYNHSFELAEAQLLKLVQSSGDAVFVAVHDGDIVGYVHANDYDLLYVPHMKNIMGIAVSAEYKLKGVGRALLLQVEQWAKDNGAEAVRLVSGAERAGAHKFYRRCGYSGDKQQLNLKKNLS